MSDLTRLDATVALATHCPNAAICVWSTFYNSPQREKAVRADEAKRCERTIERLKADNARLRAELAALKQRRSA